MSEGLPPGWYAPENGERRFWTGAEWLTPEVQTDEPPAESAESSIPGSDELASAETGGIEDLPVIAAIPSRRRRRWPAALAAVVVVIAGAAAWWFLRPTVEKEVSAQCEEALRDNLKNPGSAVFYDTRVVNNELGTSAYVADITFQIAKDTGKTVTAASLTNITDAGKKAAEEDIAARKAGKFHLWAAGEADAENSYGATTREDWLCRATVDQGNVSDASVWVFGGDYR